MGIALKISVEGLAEAQQKEIERVKALSGPVMFEAVRDGVVMVQRDAMINTAVVTGRLRGGWNIIIGQAGTSVLGVVFNNVEYVGYYEYGTKYMAARHPLYSSATKNQEAIIANIIEAVRRTVS